MRFRFRLFLVACTLLALVAGLLVSDEPTALAPARSTRSALEAGAPDAGSPTRSASASAARAATSQALLAAAEHPGAEQRLSALCALWRAVADRAADSEPVREAW